VGALSREAWRLLDQKRRYWHKALSDDAAWAIYGQTFNVFDWLRDYSDQVVSDTLLSTLVSLFLLGIPISEVEPWNLLWSVELPTPEEFAKGVLIKLERISIDDVIAELYPQFEDIMIRSVYSVVDFMEAFMESPFAEALKPSVTEKGYYDVSRYGYSYYDPIAVREFFKSTLFAFLKKRGDVRTARDRVEAIARNLNINPELARNLFNRLTAIFSVKIQALTWDYGWWDFSYWAKEGSVGRVTYINYDLQEVEVEYEDLIDFQACGYWDEYPWDYFHWCDVVHPYKLTPPIITMLVDAVWRNFVNRIHATALAVANYQTYEERTQWTASERVETFALPVSQRMFLERVVHNTVRSMLGSVDPVTMRMYKSAVLQLFAIMSSPHRWGDGALRTMSEEELKSWWLDKWSSSGLDRNVLEKLYTAVKTHLRTFSSLRFRERTRFLRKRGLG